MYAGGGSSGGGGYQIPDVRGIDIDKLMKSTEPDFIPGPTPSDKDYYRQAVNMSGSLWLSGMGLGGLYGGYEGYKGSPGTSMRVVSNSVLNGVSKRGTVLGNRLAVVSMLHTIYSFLGSTVFDEVIPSRTGLDTPLYTAPAFAGVATGASFLMGFGHKKPQVYAMGAVIGGVASCVYFAYGSMMYNTLFGTRKGGRY